MNTADWINLINDNVASWYAIFSQQQIPLTAQTQAAIALEQQRQANNTLLILGIAAIGVFALTRK